MGEKIIPSVRNHISDRSAQEIKANIALANDNEVFFVCKLEQKKVLSVEAVARGTKDAVPAIMQLAEYSDVVIHNHPSGDLNPSDADLNIATRLASLGVGSYIVDNEVTDIYIVVNAFEERKIIALEGEEIADAFKPDGLLAANLPTYEFRPQQVAMAEAVVECFNEDKIAVIEAGTGTGKSLAYLLPAIQWSLRNKERVVISTNTINLQEQLIKKDLPFFSAKLGIKFNSVLIKGRGNYLCLRKKEFHRTDLVAQEDEKNNAELKSILDWAEKTTDGSLSDITPIPSRETWETVASDQDQCLRIRCPHFEQCFFYNARRRAAQANILVANHHILMADIALRFQTENFTTAAVLPPFQRIIFDEAHNIEDVATSYFGESVSKRSFAITLNKLANDKRGNKGCLNTLSRQVMRYLYDDGRLSDSILGCIDGEIIPYKKELQAFIDRNFTYIAEAIQSHLNKSLKQGEEEKLRITHDLHHSALWEETIVPYLKNVIDEIHKFVSALRALLTLFNRILPAKRERFISPVLDIKSTLKKLQQTASTISFFISGYDETQQFCKWVRMYRGRYELFVNFNYSPILVGKNLRNAVYDVYKTVIMTSATMTVKKRFDFLMSRIGLDEVESDRLILQRLEAPFDYDKQVFCAVPIDIEQPGSLKYDRQIRDLILRALPISDGRAFVLFTSYRLMNKIFDESSGLIEQMGYSCFKQGMESRDALLRKFREDTTSVLFATSSFWEGVDVQGRALECLILTKLPFNVPTEPVLEARIEYIEAQGGDSFMEFTVPLAVIKFKQGFGRLIRAKQDFGAVLILDKRVATKAYGALFLQSLPTSNILISKTENVLGKMEEFFEKWSG